jgi:hypothetical protein
VPVFHRVREGVLVVTVDGDFTVGEIERVGERALQDPDLIRPAFVLLDLSGTAGLVSTGLDRLKPVAEYFAGPQTPVARLAIMASASVAEAVVEEATASGLESGGFKTRAAAMDWLLGF